MAEHMRLSPTQETAQIRLFHAIRRAVDAGLTVPCQADPERFDDPCGSPAWCNGCPVFKICGAYADTGAVQHGILAGRQLTPNRRRSPAHRPGALPSRPRRLPTQGAPEGVAAAVLAAGERARAV